MKKKLRIGFGFGERWRSKDHVRMLLTRSGFDVCETCLLSNHPKRPALILCAGRITVDAREKD